MTRSYVIVIERAGSSYGAYAPDVAGCVAVGDTFEETTALMTDALAMHLKGLREDGLAIPVPTTQALEVEVALPGPPAPQRCTKTPTP